MIIPFVMKGRGVQLTLLLGNVIPTALKTL